MAQFKFGDRVYTKSGHYGSYQHPRLGNRHQIDLDGGCPWVCPDDDLILAHLVPTPATPPLDIVLSHQLARATDPRVLGWDKMCQIERERTDPDYAEKKAFLAKVLAGELEPLPIMPAEYSTDFTPLPRVHSVADLAALAQPGPIEIGTHTVPHGVQYLEELDVYQISVQGGKPQRIRAEAARLRVGNPPGHYKRQRVYNAVTAACTPEQCATVWDTFCEVEARIEARRSADPCTEPSVAYDAAGRDYWLTAPGHPAFTISVEDVRRLPPATLSLTIAARGIGYHTTLKLLGLLQTAVRS